MSTPQIECPSDFLPGERVKLKEPGKTAVFKIESITKRGYLKLSAGGRMMPWVEHPARFERVKPLSPSALPSEEEK